MEKLYDMLIVGGGPGGYTAAMYAARAGLKVAVLEKLSAGGQMALTSQVDNYPGFEDGVDGYDLAEKMERQAQRFGAETVYAEVTAMELQDAVKLLQTSEGFFRGKTVVIATGANPKKLGIKKEESLSGKGVHYCAACDGMRYRGKTVAVVGGGNTAAADALALSRVAEKVFVIHRRDALRATKIYHEPLMQADNVEFLWNSALSELIGEEKLSAIQVKNLETQEVREIPCDGLFVSIGRAPATDLVAAQLTLDENGYILAGEDTVTSLGGVYAVGDVRSKLLRQIVTAVADGATAAHSAERYLAEKVALW